MALIIIIVWARKNHSQNQHNEPALVPSKRNKRIRTNKNSTRMNHLNSDLTKTTQNQILNIRAIVKIAAKKRKNQNQRRSSILKIMLSGTWSSEKDVEQKWITWSIVKRSKKRILFGHNRGRTISAISIQVTTMRKTTSKAAREETNSTAILIKHSPSMMKNQEKRSKSLIRTSKKLRKGDMNLWEKSMLLLHRLKRLPKEPM